MAVPLSAQAHLMLSKLSCWFNLPRVYSWCSGLHVGDGQTRIHPLWAQRLKHPLALLCAACPACGRALSEGHARKTLGKISPCFGHPPQTSCLVYQSTQGCFLHRSSGWSKTHLFHWSSAAGEFNTTSQNVARNLIIWKWCEGREGQTYWIIYSLLIFPAAVIEVLF